MLRGVYVNTCCTLITKYCTEITNCISNSVFYVDAYSVFKMYNLNQCQLLIVKKYECIVKKINKLLRIKIHLFIK